MLHLAATYEKVMTSCANLVSPSKCRSAKRTAAGKSVDFTLSECPGKSYQGVWWLQSNNATSSSVEESAVIEEYTTSTGLRKPVLRGGRNSLCPQWIIQLGSFALGNLWKQQSFMYEMVFLKALPINLTCLSSISAFLMPYGLSSALLVRTDVFLCGVKCTSYSRSQ